MRAAAVCVLLVATLSSGCAAVLGSLNVHVDASGLVETDTTAEILLAMDVVQNGTAVEVTAKACAITIPDVPIEGQDQPIHLEDGPAGRLGARVSRGHVQPRARSGTG